jgi:hypothetical protein
MSGNGTSIEKETGLEMKHSRLRSNRNPPVVIPFADSDCV